jgi:hypothetical protein
MSKLAEVIIWQVGEIGKIVTDLSMFETIRGTVEKIEREATERGDKYCIWAMDLDTRASAIVFTNEVKAIYDFIISFIAKQQLDDARIISTAEMRVQLMLIKYLESLNSTETLH